MNTFKIKIKKQQHFCSVHIIKVHISINNSKIKLINTKTDINLFFEGN